MAWTCSGTTNKALIENLFKSGLIRSERVKNAMLEVDRACYAPAFPYEDSPQVIGYEATISAPHMHASASEALLEHLHPNATVLDIGSGSGYLTHVLANLIGPEGRVVGVDHIEPLVQLAKDNMAKTEDGKNLLSNGKVKFVKADGRKGYKAEAPYDAIHVGAAAATLHEELIEQLKAPGRMFIPLESGYAQWIWVIDKKVDGTIVKEKREGVRYVPLTSAPSEAKP